MTTVKLEIVRDPTNTVAPLRVIQTLDTGEKYRWGIAKNEKGAAIILKRAAKKLGLTVNGDVAE